MKKFSILAAITGNILEWYDFTLYVFLGPVLALNFFPQQTHIHALLSTFFIFALGFFVRPLGSILFGHLGDRLGRTKTLKLSILFISLPTLLIGFLPTYATWGIYAGFSLAACRLLQGFCIGGEFVGSMIYLSELASVTKRGFTSSMTNNGSNLGVLGAALVTALVSNLMSVANFNHYGWRLPFLLGGLLGLIGLWTHLNLAESPVFTTLKAHKKIQILPLMTVLRSYKKPVLRVFLLVVMAAAGSYILIDFMSTYLNLYYHYTLAQALQVQSFYTALTILLVTLLAPLSDRFGRRLTLGAAALGYLVLAIPCFYLLAHHHSFIYLLPLVIVYCLEQATTPATLAENFPAPARYTGLSLGYNLGMALIGGTAPLINTWLIAKYNNPMILAYYLMAAAGIALLCISLFLPKAFGSGCDLQH